MECRTDNDPDVPLPAVPAGEGIAHCPDHQVWGVQLQLLRVVTQIHDGDVDNLSFGDLGREAKQGVACVDHSPDIACAEVVGRGYTMLHQVFAGCQPGMDITGHCNGEGGDKTYLFHRFINPCLMR